MFLRLILESNEKWKEEIKDEDVRREVENVRKRLKNVRKLIDCQFREQHARLSWIYSQQNCRKS